MKSRCYNEKQDYYKTYGGRGIKVCDMWLNDYQLFAQWSMENGYNKTLTLDRIDNNGDYEPENCRWVTGLRQANNKSNNVYVNMQGKTQSVADWCRELKLSYSTIQHRVSGSGMSYLEALTKPVTPKYKSIKIKDLVIV